MDAKQVKKLISDRMTDRRNGISVSLGECDDQMDRILIKYPFMSSINLNPVVDILRKHKFEVHQIIYWWFPKKNTILLIREKPNKGGKN